MEPTHYCHNPYHYQRRLSREVKVGRIGIGGANPIRVQSMLTCDTMDTRECVKQTLDLVKVGCEIVRITAPTVKDAANLKNIKAELVAAGCDVPIVADIHFKPDAAMEAAQWVEKVRVNPGNFADKKKFAIREYTDEQYVEELERIDETFKPLVAALPAARHRHAHRHEPRLAFRPHHEPLRRHAGRHGGERGGVRPHRAQVRLPRFRFLDEVEQPEGDDQRLPAAGRAAARAGPGLELSAAPRRDRGGRRRGRPDQERDRHRRAAGRRPGRHDPRLADRGQRA